MNDSYPTPPNSAPEHNTSSALGRILPSLILISVIGGFVSLAIYAYKAGSQNVAEGELMVVEADQSPMKEKPEDPGGMQFPNQDKTIFETFSSSGAQPPKVERVLPTPEEPIAKEESAGEPTAWINDKLSGAAADTPPAPENKPASEEVFSQHSPVAVAAPVQPVASAAPAPSPSNEAAPAGSAKVVDVREELGKQAVLTASASSTPPPVELKKEPFAPEKVAAKKTPDKKSAAATQMVQLGAFKSEEEARAEFGKMQKKYAALSGAAATVNRADLGDKGIYYRLRVATSDAKALCTKLDGQACMVVR